MLTSPAPRSEHNPTQPAHRTDARVAADKALASQRLHTFLEDKDICPAHTYGSTSAAEAQARTREKLKRLEEAFNKASESKQRGRD
jgi:hypothetical protein